MDAAVGAEPMTSQTAGSGEPDMATERKPPPRISKAEARRLMDEILREQLERRANWSSQP